MLLINITPAILVLLQYLFYCNTCFTAILVLLQFGAMLGMHDLNADQMTKKLEETLPVIQEVSRQFKNPVGSVTGRQHK